MARAGTVKWDQRASAAANARRHLPSLVMAYFAQVREFLAGNPAPPQLHALRLSSKRLRYTLELFRPCYARGLEARLDALKKLQDSLGEVNDAVASARLLRGSLRRQPKLREFLEQKAARQAAEFAAHWKKVFDAPGREAWWTRYLSRPVTQTKNIYKRNNPKHL